MITTIDLCLRLGSAVLTGVLVGIDRESHAKAVGVRTLGLVGLGSALMTLAGSGFSGEMDSNASRAIQGLITGIGFLGAGVIVKREDQKRVHGLTTAASIWITAALGVGCGLGAYQPVLVNLGLMAILLTGGGYIDRMVRTHFVRKGKGEAECDGGSE